MVYYNPLEKNELKMRYGKNIQSSW